MKETLLSTQLLRIEDAVYCSYKHSVRYLETHMSSQDALQRFCRSKNTRDCCFDAANAYIEQQLQVGTRKRMLFNEAARHGRRSSEGKGDAFGRTDTNAHLMTALENSGDMRSTSLKESTFIAAKEFLSRCQRFFCYFAASFSSLDFVYE
jgi:hypothetical protein